ncbi:MAG TPA: energy transducer TonB, partial [Candidatus Polarisedimenticolia bacterium]|nr:energy transducer TonB [Candidatus Polarisedimenticolia bacterium]
GGTGTGTGGGGDESQFYFALLKRAIERAWHRPVYTGSDTKSATVSLSLSRTGRVLRLELSKPSGYEPFDRTLLRAVRDAEPFPPFPVSLTVDSLAVQIVFDLHPEGSDTGNPGD